MGWRILPVPVPTGAQRTGAGGCSSWWRCYPSMSAPGSLAVPPVINRTRSTFSAWDNFEERLVLSRPVNLLLMNCLQ